MDRPQNSSVQIEFEEPDKPDIPGAILALVNRFKKGNKSNLKFYQ